MKNTRRSWSLLAALALVFLAGTTSLSAQGSTTSAVAGTVRDADGSPVTAAQVMVRNANTGVTYQALTNAEGRYFVPHLTPGGGYVVEVTSLGYAMAIEEAVSLTLGSVYTLDFNLRPEAVSLGDILVTTARGDVFSPSHMGTQTTIQEAEIETLPTIDRHINDLAALSPYVSLTGDAPSIGGQNNRMNNIQIDGAVNNDVFGLADSGVPGGQADAKPISIDAISQFEVLVAPFDVRHAGFSGGLINAVTKSGTNRWSGSLYGYYRDESFLNSELPYSVPFAGGSLQDTLRTADFLDRTLGFSLGGPIIQDKLHLFTAGEFQERRFPQSWGWESDEAQIRQAQDSIQRFMDILENTYQLDPGDPSSYALENPSSNFFGRLDWRPSEQHRVTLRHNWVSANDDDSPSRRGSFFELSSATYNFASTTNSTVFQLHSTLSERTFNEFLANYQTIRDRRDPLTRYSRIVVDNDSDLTGGGSVSGSLAAGAEFYSQANELDQDIIQLTNNLTRLMGDHRVTLGGQYEFYKFRNLFAPGTLGEWEFNSLADFEAGTPNEYFVNVIYPGVDDVAARFGVHNFSLYGQDEWSVSDRLTLTGGLRVDVPILPDAPRDNPDFSAAFDGRSTADVPSGNFTFSPRVGFNWQSGAQELTQIRGGVGLFTGRPPFVWLSNQYGNTGRELVGLNCFGANVPAFDPLNPPSTCADNVPPTAGGVMVVNTFDEDFRFPQDLKANLAIDQELPWDLRATVEGLFTRAVNQIVIQELNIIEVENAPAEAGIGDRPIYGTPVDFAFDAMQPNRVDGGFGPVVELTNASDNYAYMLNFELAREFLDMLNVRGAYTYSRSFDTQSLTSSQATSNIGYNPIRGDINSPDLAPSNFDRPHRLLLSATADFLPEVGGGTSVTLFYVGRSGKPYSYMYDGDVNGDGYEMFGVVNNRNNDLVYIPAAAGEVTFRSAEDERLFNELVDLEECLQDQAGQIMERNSCRAPWVNTLNLKAKVGLPVPSTRGRVALTLDMFNVLNLLNQDWGLEQAPAFNTMDLLQLRGRDNATGDMQFDYDGWTETDETDTVRAVRQYTTYFSSRWNIQAGLRLSF